MDEPHPLYILLCRHSINARLCLLFGLIFVSVKFAVLPVQNMDQGIFFWGILIAAACSPALCFPYIAAIWIKITPITDRVTYYEEEFIFLLSVFIGTSFFLYLAFPIHPMEGLRLGGGLTAILAPFSVLVWALKSIVAPLSKRNLSAQVESAQQYRDTTPNFLRNILACCAAGLATAVTNLLLLLILFESQGQPLFGHVPFISAYGFLFMSILTAPLLVFFGRLLISRQSEPLGRHYAIGGIASIFFIGAIDLSSPLFNEFEYWNLANTLNSLKLVAFISIGFLAGGLVFSKLYKHRPVSLEFI